MTSPESKTVHHPLKGEEKTHNTDSQNTFRATSSTKKDNNHTKKLRTQHKTPQKSKENQTMDKKV